MQKVIAVAWFFAKTGVQGIVITQNETGEFKAWLGLAPGRDIGQDAASIGRDGAKFPLSLAFFLITKQGDIINPVAFKELMGLKDLAGEITMHLPKM